MRWHGAGKSESSNPAISDITAGDDQISRLSGELVTHPAVVCEHQDGHRGERARPSQHSSSNSRQHIVTERFSEPNSSTRSLPQTAGECPQLRTNPRGLPTPCNGEGWLSLRSNPAGVYSVP